MPFLGPALGYLTAQCAARSGEIWLHLTGMMCPWAGNLTANCWKMSNPHPMPCLPPRRLYIDRCINIVVLYQFTVPGHVYKVEAWILSDGKKVQDYDYVYARSAFYPSLRFTLSLQSAYYPWSAVCSLRFKLTGWDRQIINFGPFDIILAVNWFWFFSPLLYKVLSISIARK